VRATCRDAAPPLAAILGSGWQHPLARVEEISRIDYADVPGLGKTGVEGHAGRLLAVRMDGTDVLLFFGRRHWYEGEGWEPVAVPVYLSKAMGVRTVLITNAAGGLAEDLAPGDFMIVKDHINAMGANPLLGPHDPLWGPRFVDQTAVYVPALQTAVEKAARQVGIEPTRGVYAAVTGPAFETPAEVAALRAIGADAVGMSTVPEAMLAHAAGMGVAAVSFIANAAAGSGHGALTHDEVLETSRRHAPLMAGLVAAILRLLAARTER
jgi:purine-nucleoside phosphorylase